MKKLLMLLLCISLLLSCGISASAAGTADVQFAAASTEAKPGDKITLEVTVSCSDVCTSLGLSLEYDSSVFEVVKGKCGLKNGMLSIFDKERGFAYLYPNGVTPNGTLGTVTMKVKENAPAGVYEVSGQFSAGNDDKSISASVTGVSITVKESSAKQEPTQAVTTQTEPQGQQEPQEQTGVTQAPEEENQVIPQNPAPETEKKPTAQTNSHGQEIITIGANPETETQTTGANTSLVELMIAVAVLILLGAALVTYIVRISKRKK